MRSGKTTLAKALAQDHAIVRFLSDECMIRLFGEDPAAEAFREREAALTALNTADLDALPRTRVEVVLNFGI